MYRGSPFTQQRFAMEKPLLACYGSPTSRTACHHRRSTCSLSSAVAAKAAARYARQKADVTSKVCPKDVLIEDRGIGPFTVHRIRVCFFIVLSYFVFAGIGHGTKAMSTTAAWNLLDYCSLALIPPSIVGLVGLLLYRAPEHRRLSFTHSSGSLENCVTRYKS